MRSADHLAHLLEESRRDKGAHLEGDGTLNPSKRSEESTQLTRVTCGVARSGGNGVRASICRSWQQASRELAVQPAWEGRALQQCIWQGADWLAGISLRVAQRREERGWQTVEEDMACNPIHDMHSVNSIYACTLESKGVL